ncbi:MAG TPA: fasciclin domain-containing protein [Acidimicrobiia bacterium]|nr:fasciclin domain-containing protein [Acidimicrobiia bacterium]
MKRRLILLWALMASLIAACGGAAADSDSTTSTSVAPATTTTSAPEPEPADIVGVATEAGSFSTLLTAVEAAGLVETLQGEGPFTVFAPTDEAFAALPEGTLDSLLADSEALSQVLLYHVVPGEVMASDVIELDSATTAQGEDIAISVEGDSVKVNQAEVIATDVAASNGVIHVIDQVILPPSMSMEEAEMGDIVEIAEAAGDFSTLLTAVEAAGLVETLKGDGPFTVFAPTDEAFAALPEGTLDALLADTEALTQVLLYHVVPGAVTAEQVVGLDSAQTVEGGSVSIRVEDEKVFINDAEVIATDVLASNGVIHAIDQVIIPG